MPLEPIAPPPGVCLAASSYASGKDAAYVGSGSGAFRQGSGRWTDATNIEFIAGFPQKIAGWAQASGTATTGIPRAEKVWRDNAGNANIGIGTETHLYYVQNSTLTDITPVLSLKSGTLTNALTTTGNSDIVAVADSAQQLQNVDFVFLSAASQVGGVTIDGWYPVSNRTGTGYDITLPFQAATSQSAGGGIIDYEYPRITLTNPFTTTMGSPIVTVQDASGVAIEGGFVDYSGGTAVGGLTLNGEYQIQSVVDSSHYTITAASPATSGATGGGAVSVTYDIIVPQSATATGVGYGLGAYGIGAYGLGVPGGMVLNNGWTLDAYGYQLLAAPIGGTIYVFDPSFGGRAYPLLNAPSTVLAMFVTPERFVVALGINGNLLQLAWPDQNDYTDWTTTATNTANSGRTLIGGSYFTGGIAIINGVSLIFSDKCCFQMNYVGGQEVYNTPLIGNNCGLVDPTAVVTEGGVAYWMSDQDFWTYNGTPAPLNTDDIREYIFGVPNSGDQLDGPPSGVLNRQYLTKCTAQLNRKKRQARFWFPSQSSTEPDMGVIYQYDQQCFTLMGFGRTCGQDAELLQTPTSADTTGIVYYDETGTDANGAALPYNLALSDMDVSNGDRNVDVFGFIPDFQSLAQPVSLTVQTAYYPDQTPNEGGPFVLTTATGRQDFRLDGKLFGFSLAADAMGATFRLGVPRVDVQPAGARR
jgi:hypothetical protein